MNASTLRIGIARLNVTRFAQCFGTALQNAELRDAATPKGLVYSFHSSPPTKLPVRRRRGGRRGMNKAQPSNSEETPANPLKHAAVVDSEIFRDAASDLLLKLELALQPMKEKNDIFVISRDFENLGPTLSIDLSPEDGTYIVEVNEEERLLQFSSPISGTHLYVLSKSTGEWVGAEDGHLFEGLLVRDLIRQCKGLPDL